MAMFSGRQKPSRRSFLKTSIVSAAASALLPGALMATPIEIRKHFRVVQITDTHVEEAKHGAYVRELLDRIVKHEKPDMIIHTGDVIMDALGADKVTTSEQWKVWNDAIAGCQIPVNYCLGNHDVWWDMSGKGDSLYGKAWGVKELKLPGRYYSITQQGWHLIFLDSIHQDPNTTYVGKIDEEQMNWLRSDLEKLSADVPVLICSHIPFLSASVYELAKRNSADWIVIGSLMHDDSLDIQKLLRQYPNVKGCISGHIHLEDHIRYDQIQYLGCAAVSGNWWKGSLFHQTTSGYAVLDLTAEGQIIRQYKMFDWEQM